MENPSHACPKRLTGGWRDIGEHEHFVQFYDEDAGLVESVAGFLGGGLLVGAACVVIATREHRVHLGARLRARGFDMDHALESGQYVALDAESVLADLMVNGRPDAALFDEFVGALIARVELHYPRVLAFGEMVALLSRDGKHEMAVELEKLWNRLAEQHDFSLFCAYPRDAFGADERVALGRICNEHSAVVAG
jgi:hypothetical protein